MIFLVYLMGAAVSPASGILIRRFGRRQAVTLSVGTACLGLVASLQASLPMIIVGLALFVMGTFTMMSAAMGFVGQAAKQAKATAIGCYVCIYYIGGSAGSVLPGILVWHRAGWPGCVGLVVVVLGVALSLAWQAWREKRLL
jgi:MFS family permease